MGGSAGDATDAALPLPGGAAVFRWNVPGTLLAMRKCPMPKHTVYHRFNAAFGRSAPGAPQVTCAGPEQVAQ